LPQNALVRTPLARCVRATGPPTNPMADRAPVIEPSSSADEFRLAVEPFSEPPLPSVEEIKPKRKPREEEELSE